MVLYKQNHHSIVFYSTCLRIPHRKEFVLVLVRLKTMIYLTFNSVSWFRLVSGEQSWFQVIITAILHVSTISSSVCSALWSMGWLNWDDLFWLQAVSNLSAYYCISSSSTAMPAKPLDAKAQNWYTITSGAFCLSNWVTRSTQT